MQYAHSRSRQRYLMPLAGLDQNFAQFLFLEVNVTPLQGHDIDNSETARMKGKEKHFDKLLTARLGIVLIKTPRVWQVAPC